MLRLFPRARLTHPLSLNPASKFPAHSPVSTVPLTYSRRPYSASAYTPYVRTRNFLLGTGGIVALVLLTDYYFDSRAAIHRYAIMPALRLLDPETTHRMAVWTLKWGLGSADRNTDDEVLKTEVWGKTFSNPVGVAAGFDKHAEAIDGLFDLGFGYVEVGSVTPEPQPGNAKPRMFRLPADRAVINRYGFNSEGHAAVLARLRERLRRYLYRASHDSPQPISDSLPAAVPNQSLREGRVLGLNLGKNKASDPDSVEDYVKGIERLGAYGDLIVVNISSPNTPGLRGLQRRELLERLLLEVVKARDQVPSKPPLLVKIAPDLTPAEVEDMATVFLNSGVDGVIVSNTTVQRPATLNTTDAVVDEVGGLSGPPVKPLALNTLRQLYRLTNGKMTLVGCGGISSGADAIEYARAGASLVQLYTSFAYDGVGVPARVKDEIVKILKREGKTWRDIIGEEGSGEK
ncbi:uncharacterized protein VTP21DRAFT_3106 [Calcarisporiella thermophila]|uniref:uncharacterized protein n=1 Tax=Calcarisporiella thermophila TaxID=911321 RepID=UPI003743164B